jgi:DNA primase
LIAQLAQTNLGESVAALLRDPYLPVAARLDAQPKEALDGWWHFYGLLRGEAELEEDRRIAAVALAETNDPAAQQRVIRLTQALAALRRGEAELGDAADVAEATGRDDEGHGSTASPGETGWGEAEAGLPPLP